MPNPTPRARAILHRAVLICATAVVPVVPSAHAAGTVGSHYTTWFGAYDATRYTTVKSHFNAISGALATA